MPDCAMNVSVTARLNVLDRIPERLLDLEAQQLHELLPGPTLIHLSGLRPEPLFVAVLLHGNETTGWQAARRVLQRFAGQPLPRSLSLFVGNVKAARFHFRRLEGETDFNRAWPGTETPHDPIAALMQSVTDEMGRRRVFCSIDIHNNTGLNPHYACVTRLNTPSLQLARLFSRTVVRFERPRGTQAAAFAALCPAVTIECGKPGVAANDLRAAEFIEACLHLSHFPEHPVPKHDLDLYHTVAVVKIPASVSFGFGADNGELVLAEELESFNFRDLPPGTRLARVRAGSGARLAVTDDSGVDVGTRYLETVDGELRLRQPVMPAMLTRDTRIIRQDCLCYFMERLPYAPEMTTGG